MDGPTEICKEDKISLDENCGDEVRNGKFKFLNVNQSHAG